MSDLEAIQQGKKIVLPIQGKNYCRNYFVTSLGREEIVAPINYYLLTFGEYSMGFSVDRYFLRFNNSNFYSAAGYTAAKLEEIIEKDKHGRNQKETDAVPG